MGDVVDADSSAGCQASRCGHDRNDGVDAWTRGLAHSPHSLVLCRGQLVSAAQADRLPSNRTLFSAQGLTKTYGSGETEVRALRGVGLEIETGEVIVLLGPSGSGKSTLLNILGGLDQVTSGRLFFGTQELSALGDRGLTAYRRETTAVA